MIFSRQGGEIFLWKISIDVGSVRRARVPRIKDGDVDPLAWARAAEGHQHPLHDAPRDYETIQLHGRSHCDWRHK
jgi:hypothetical protein